MRAIMVFLLIVSAIGSFAFAQHAGNAELAPSGQLRVAMISANPVLVSRNPDGALKGISVELGAFIAGKLGGKLVPVLYADPEAYTRSFGKNEWDIAIGPRRASEAEKVNFSPDFMLVDNVYVAAPGKSFRDASEVDRPGIRIGVVQDGAPDKFLTGKLKSATLVRVPGQIDAAIELLRSGGADVYGSNGEFTYSVAEKLPGAIIVPGAFTTVHMAVSLPKDRSDAAQSRLRELVREAIAAGLPRKVIEDEKLKGVRPTTN